MFRKLRQALDAALSALESRSGGAGEDIDELLAAMREELIETKAQLPVLESQIRSMEAARERELGEAEQCARRARQALAIDDQETVEVALRFEARHRTQVDVFDQKIEAARAELALQRETVQEQTAQLKSALARKDALAAQARRAGTTERLRGSRYSSIDAFDRMEEEIERGDEVGSAAREVEEGLAGTRTPPAEVEAPIDAEDLADFQLRELKRRMREERGETDD